MNMSSPWLYLPPLLLVAAAFVAGMGMVGRTARKPETSAGDQPTIRWALVALLLLVAAVHVPLIGEHLEEAPYMGVAFAVFVAVAFVVATGLALGPSRLGFAVAAGLCGCAIVAFLATRLTAFPQISDDVGNWSEPLGIVALATETAVVALSRVATRRLSLRRSSGDAAGRRHALVGRGSATTS
jgi:hypothetical protein